MRRLFAQRARGCCRTHISRAWIYIFHVGRKAKAFFILLQHMQDVAFLRNSFNKFRQAENILRPFLFSFVSGRRRRCRAARVQWALPIHTHNCDRQADVGQVRGGAHLSRARSIQIGLFLSLDRSLACGHLLFHLSLAPCKRSSRFTPSLAWLWGRWCDPCKHTPASACAPSQIPRRELSHSRRALRRPGLLISDQMTAHT